MPIHSSKALHQKVKLVSQSVDVCQTWNEEHGIVRPLLSGMPRLRPMPSYTFLYCTSQTKRSSDHGVQHLNALQPAHCPVPLDVPGHLPSAFSCFQKLCKNGHNRWHHRLRDPKPKPENPASAPPTQSLPHPRPAATSNAAPRRAAMLRNSSASPPKLRHFKVRKFCVRALCELRDMYTQPERVSRFNAQPGAEAQPPGARTVVGSHFLKDSTLNFFFKIFRLA